MLIIHDNGRIIATMRGSYTNPAALVAEVPENMIVTGVDLDTGEIIMEPVPLTEAQRLQAMEKVVADKMVSENDGSAEQPVPFVYGMPVKKGGYYEYGGSVYEWKDNDSAACVWMPDSGIWQWEKK